MVDLDRVGGIPVVMRELLNHGLLHGDVLTCTGKTLAENLKDTPCLAELGDQDIVFPGEWAPSATIDPDPHLLTRFRRLLLLERNHQSPDRAHRWDGILSCCPGIFAPAALQYLSFRESRCVSEHSAVVDLDLHSAVVDLDLHSAVVDLDLHSAVVDLDLHSLLIY
jgi:hypothetical protein